MKGCAGAPAQGPRGPGRRHAFVNGVFERTGGMLRVVLQGHGSLPAALKSVAWKDIQCTTVSDAIKASPCAVGASTKLFFRHAKTLDDYIHKVGDGTVAKGEHGALWRVILSTFRGDFVNHTA